MVNRSCPNTFQIVQYSLGKLPAGKATLLERHFVRCAECRVRLEAAADAEDAFSDLVRNSASKAKATLFQHEPELQRVLSAIKKSVPAHGYESCDQVQSGELIRDYEILEKLGEGGMGQVYRARHTKLDKYVAFKVLHPQRIHDVESISRFQREMRAAGRLEHPNIIRAMDAGQEGGVHFLVTELVEGIDLAEVARMHKHLRVADACDLVRQAALGLGHAHRRKLVHRDIKPSNLMLSRDGHVKVLDLGLAQLFHWSLETSNVTTQGAWVGTLRYLAPEAWNRTGASIDHRSDIYGLGLTLCELLFASLPHGSPTDRSSLESIANQRSDIPPRVLQVISRMIATNPEERIQAAEEVAEELEPFSNDADLKTLLVATKDGTLPVTARVARQRNAYRLPYLLVSMLGACVVLLLMVVGMVLFPNEAPGPGPGPGPALEMSATSTVPIELGQDVVVHLPKIPLPGYGARYSCTLRLRPNATEIPYQVAMDVLSEGESKGSCWIQIKIDGPSLTETSTILVDRTHFNQGMGLQFREGWSEATIPEHATRLGTLVGPTVVVPFDPHQDQLAKLAHDWRISWPTRLSTQEALALLFDADCRAVRDEIRFIRTEVGAAAERNIDSEQYHGPKGIVSGLRIKDKNGGYDIIRGDEIPFNFLKVTIDKGGYFASLSINDYREQQRPQAVHREHFQQQVRKLLSATQPPAHSLIYATLPERPGSWVSYIGSLGSSEIPFSAKLIALNGEDDAGIFWRWLQVRTESLTAHSATATLRFDQRRYLEDRVFSIDQAWLLIEGECFDMTKQTMEGVNQCLRWLGKSTSPQTVSIQEILSLLFDARFTPANEFEAIRKKLAALVVNENKTRLADDCTVVTRHGHQSPGQQWNLSTSDQDSKWTYVIQRSEQIPFGFGRVILKVPNVVELASDVDDFGWSDGVEAVDSAVFQSAMQETRERLRDSGVRLWSSEVDGSECYGKIEVWTDGNVMIRSANDGTIQTMPFLSLSKADRDYHFGQSKRLWQTLTGHTRDAVFWSVDEKHVTLLTDPDGTVLRVRLSALSRNDRAYALERGNGGTQEISMPSQ